MPKRSTRRASSPNPVPEPTKILLKRPSSHSNVLQNDQFGSAIIPQTFNQTLAAPLPISPAVHITQHASNLSDLHVEDEVEVTGEHTSSGCSVCMESCFLSLHGFFRQIGSLCRHSYRPLRNENESEQSGDVANDGEPRVIEEVAYPPDCEVEDWMRRRLIYFFMTPIQKYQAKHRLPFKLFIELIKLIVVTLQIVQFGLSRASHVSFGLESNRAFCHLYLLNWDPQYETLPYPPAVGPYAIYRQEDVYRTLAYAIQQYNKTEKIAIGAYIFETLNPKLTICRTSILPVLTNSDSRMIDQVEDVQCIHLQLTDISPFDVDKPDQMEAFLRAMNISTDFATLIGFDVTFNLLSPILTKLSWIPDAECLRFSIQIAIQKNLQAGVMRIDLLSDYQSVSCRKILSTDSDNVTSNGHVRQLWTSINSTSFSASRLSLHLILVTILDVMAVSLSLLSFILCIRSMVRGFRLWEETVVFFRVWFSFKLVGVIGDFVSPWWLFILLNDLLIFGSSLFRVVTVYKMQHTYEPVSYIFGISALLVWSGVLRFIAFSSASSLLLRTIVRSIPALVRFMVCAMILFFAFSLCGWLVLGPYHIKFRNFFSTMECLFSLLNGDDMYVTFSVIEGRAPLGVYLFSRVFLYLFVSLFIYVVLNVLITIIFEAYEEVKENRDCHNRPHHSALWHFLEQRSFSSDSPLFREDDCRPDRHILHCCSLGLQPYHRSATDCLGRTSQRV